MNKNVLLICAAILISQVCFAGGVREQELEEINVSYVKSPFNLPSIIMKERGMLENELRGKNIEVRYHEIVSGAKQAQAMAAGSLDIGGVMNTTSVLLARASENDVRIIAGFSRPVKIFAIVVMDPDISSIADLAGKRIAGPKGTVLHQLLAAALTSEGLSMDDVEFLEMGLSQASTAMISGQIDAALLAGSLLIKAQESGAHVIVTADGYVIPKLVVAARGPFVDAHPEIVDTYVQVHRNALKWTMEHLEEALAIGAEEQGITIENAARLYDWTEFITTLTEEDVLSMEEDILFMEENDMLREKIDPRECICESAVN